MPRLASVPDRPPRAVAYVRVSTARDDMISPDLQLTAIRDHCSRAGYTLIETIEDLDLSGRFWKRRQVDRAISMIEAGDADVLVVWKWSRVTRNRLDWAVAVDRVESAGGQLVSATEPIDTTTSAGRLQRGMLAEFAAFESDRIGDVWREVQARRTRAGLPADGKARFGYRVVDGRSVPDPITGPVLASLYRRYIAGESIHSLARWANSEGISTARGWAKSDHGQWSEITMRRVLDAGFGAGLIQVHGEKRSGAHQPVIDDVTWQQYLASRAQRRKTPGSERSQYLLSSMVRCMFEMPDGSPCDSPMAGGSYSGGRQSKFRCTAVAKNRAHGGGYVVMTYIEDRVMEWLAERAAGVDDLSDKVAQRSPGLPRQKRDLDVIAREITELDGQLANLTVQLARGVIPEGAYVQARDQIADEKHALEERHARALLAAQESEVGPIAASLLTDWEVLTVAERRTILRRMITQVEIVTKRPAATVRVVSPWGVRTY